MRLDDFERLTPGEFSAVCQAFAERQEARREDAWEMMRLHASISVQPHLAKRVTPKQLLPLPWDGKPAPATERRPGKAERLARLRKRIRRERGDAKNTRATTGPRAL